MPLKLTTYYRGKDIPDLPGTNTFHSKELFQIYESTPGYTPLLIVATEEGRPVARLLAAIRKTKKWLPSSLVKQCVVYGAGEFLDTSLPASKEKEEEIFGEMLEHLTQEASRTCILIEFRNLDNSMFGYRFFRKNDFFPVNWLRVRNSLHSTQKAEDRFSPSRIRQIRKGLKNGAKVVEAHTVEEIKEFFTNTEIFPCQWLFPPHEQHAYQRKTGKNIHRKIQGKDYRRLRLHLFRRKCFYLVFRRNAKDLCTAVTRHTGSMEST